MRERLVPLAAMIIATGVGLTSKSAIAESTSVTPVNPSLMSEAINCVLTAKPGKRILFARAYSGVVKGERQITLFDRDKKNKYTVEMYPYDVDSAMYPQYLEVYKRPNGTLGNNDLTYYFDGEYTPAQELVGRQSVIDASKTADGIVDIASYPQDKKDQNHKKQFQSKIGEHQKGYTAAIEAIVEGCRGN